MKNERGFTDLLTFPDTPDLGEQFAYWSKDLIENAQQLKKQFQGLAFKLLETDENKYPPFDIAFIQNPNPDGTGWRLLISIAMAGATSSEIQCVSENLNTVSVRYQPAAAGPIQKAYRYLTPHRGLSKRGFSRSFQFTRDIEVEKVTYENGVLEILLKVHPQSREVTIHTVITRT